MAGSLESIKKWCCRLVVGVVFLSIVIDPGTSRAQNGQILDNIYRNMYEAQAERDRQIARQQQTAFGTRVEPVPRATSAFPGQVIGPAQTTLVPQTAQPAAPSPFSRTGEVLPANWFLDSLGSIRDNVGRLIPELQRYSSSVPAAREVFGDIYQINADAVALYSRTRSGEPIDSIFASYQQMDVRWRDVSYRLRASGSLDARLTALVSAIDSSFQTTDRRFGITPPIDRVRLRDLMIVTLTYMDAMFDDVRLAPGAFSQADILIRDGRILRERLRQESHKIDRADYDEVVASYAEFVRQWRTYAARLYALNDAHVNLRLDSIRRQGDEVYASLRIQAATDRRQLQFAGQRLTAALLALQDELVRWGVSRLPTDQARFADTVRILVDRSQYLETELSKGSAIATASAQFAEMDHIWTEGLRSMRAIDARSGLQTSLVRVDVIFGEMRDLLQIGPWHGQSELLSTVASLEAATDDFNIDVQRFKRYLTPVTFRDSLSQVSDDLHKLSSELHRTLDERSDMREASRLAQQLIERWQQLSPMIGELNARGLSPSRTELLYEDYRVMQPLIAQAASMLLN